ncbi:helix-turn-helix domain-containing protein [Xylanivirga thermophila]|uniref:helix-turn-helix domain-containing protein n=1 Tax=Xylanivirga thermophila TaxID=2496273 RepID=UPI00101E0EC0|nr:helix-turn-helix transcriptional regulator [Xylanivirga thermophila]
MEFGQRLKLLRNIKKTTQEELANFLGVGRPTIAGYETKGTQPSFEILEKIADFFDVSIDYLLGRSDIPKPYILDNDAASYKIFVEINNLSPESQKELEKLIELYKLRDIQKRNSETSDELTGLD